MYTLKLQHHFAAAHHLKSAYSEECRRPQGHGHTFEVIVKIETNKLVNNMVADFKLIKEIIDELDHRYLNKVLKFDPTAENVSKYLQEKIKNKLQKDTPDRFIDVELELFEGPGASIKFNDRDEALGAWLAGFMDGEGYFMLYEYNGALLTRCGFELRADDKSIVYEVQKHLEAGRISFRKNKDSFSPTKTMVVFEINRRSDLVNKIIPLFDRYPLRAKKKRDYAIWKEGVLLLYNRESSKISDRTKKEFKDLVNKLKEVRKFYEN